MEQPISAAKANREFSTVLKGFRDGNSYVVTSHGKPVARIVPAGRHYARVSSAREEMLTRLAQQRVIDIGSWTRDQLYEDEEGRGLLSTRTFWLTRRVLMVPADTSRLLRLSPVFHLTPG